jgi:Amt family ammonium transporter
VGLRITDEEEATGIDETEHAETGYDFSSHRSVSGLGTPRPPAGTAAGAQIPATAGKEA